MPTEKTLDQYFIVGFDLRDDTCQMSVMEDPGPRPPKEPVTFSLEKGKEKFDIPTAISKVIGENRWAFGFDAAAAASDGSSTYIPKLLSLAIEGSPVRIENAQYEPTALLALYISRCLALLSDMIPVDNIEAVMFTSRVMDQKTIAVLQNVTSRLGLSCRMYYESYASSWYNMMLMQATSVREPATLLAEYETGSQLRIEKLYFNQHTKPIVAYRKEKIYPGLFGETPKEKDAEFAGIMQAELKGRFSSVYLIGNGFGGGWLDRSIPLLCKGRRVFLGSNIFSKGAGYGGYFKLRNPEICDQYIFLDGNKLQSNIGVKALVRGQEDYVSIIDAGVNWYEVDTSCDLVLEETNEIRLLLTPLTGGTRREEVLLLDGLPAREGRTTRVRLSFSMTSPVDACVHVEDLGFGEIYPSTGLSWDKKFSLSEEDGKESA